MTRGIILSKFDGKDHISFFFVVVVVVVVVFFRAIPTAYGSSQTRGSVRAIAAGLCHSSWQRWILNPLNKARG